MSEQTHGLQELDAIAITLQGEKRSDGSVFISSPELPMFSAVGCDEKDALDNAVNLLVPYLEANVPDYVDLKRLRGAADTQSHADFCLPAHIIAFRGSGNDGYENQ
ncbi:MAG: hypothetical protein R3E09_02500 [Novosphingobium sp.]|nr:hypothetical protein [Novosphingobium sp.]